MKIQKLLFPQIGRCTDEELYYRLGERKMYADPRPAGDPFLMLARDRDWLEECRADRAKLTFDRTAETVTFLASGKLWFDTYFNGFSVAKWAKYTVIGTPVLELRLKGAFRVTLLQKEKIQENLLETVLLEQTVTAASEQTFRFSYEAGTRKGMYAFKVEALEDGSVFYGGAYSCEVPREQVRDVRIGIGICTFRREPFIEKNLRILRESILENEASPMYGHLEVFVSDNGQTLDIERLTADHIHIHPNRNLGGAGGFTRDLIEIREHNEELHVTHALLMDDDVVVEPEAIVKTYTILSLLKDEYVDTFIGGAMLRLDKQYEQVEAGACWNAGELDSHKSGMDLRLLDCCLYNEVEETAEFNAWWYCCFPMTIVREDNLPLPIFIRGDDLEYGLRNMRHLILMNGICVWHEAFEHKYSSFLEYYIIRNQLIDNAFHCPWYGAKQLKRTMWMHCKQEIMYYRYKNVDLYLRGIDDFCKGPQWLMQQDGEALHKEIMAAGYKAQPIDALPMAFSYPMYDQSRRMTDTPRMRRRRILTFNGLLLPVCGDNVVPMAAVLSPQFYRRGRVMHYDVTSAKAFITERSVGTSIKYMFKVLRCRMTLSGRLRKAQQAWRTEGTKLRTLEFWKNYLGLK